MGDTTFALNSAGMNIQNPAQVTTYGGWFDLNGFTLTKSGSAFLGLQQCSITNPGSINLAGGELRLNHAVLSGPGSLNLSNGTTLSCGTSGTTSLVAKASLNIPANATITAPFPRAASVAPCKPPANGGR